MKRKKSFEISCPHCPCWYTLTLLGEKDADNFNKCLNNKDHLVFVRLVTREVKGYGIA